MKEQLLRMAVTITNVPDAVRRRSDRSDRGQGATEYVGIAAFVALIMVAIFGLDLDDTVSGALSDAINDIIGD